MTLVEECRRIRRISWLIPAMAWLLSGGITTALAGPAESKAVVPGGKILGTIDTATYVQNSLIFSPDGRHAIWLSRSKDRHQFFLDGVPGPLFEGTFRPPVFWSPDGRRVAYLVENEQDHLQSVIADGSFGPVFDKIVSGTPVFSPDSRRIAYAGFLKGRYEVLLDGVPGPKYDLVGHLSFSPDGRRFAYAAEKDKRRFVVVDGVSGPRFDDVYPVGFSPDSRHLVYYATQGKKHRVVVDDHAGPEYNSIGPVRFIPAADSSPPAIGYIALAGNQLVEVTQAMP